jgi:rod shape-determining protein MreC
MPRKRLLLFLLVVIASLGVMTYQINREHFIPFRFLTSPLSWIHSSVTSIINTVSSPFKLMLIREEENKKLREEVNALTRERQISEEVLRENRRLREALSLKEKEHQFVTATRVISRGFDIWSNTLVLDKGLSGGIVKDMTAVSHKGLIGKISESTESYSHLLLLTDINFSAAVRFQESRKEGIISGTGFRKCQLKYIPYDEEVKQGDILITSGLDMLFPAGIPAGFVSRIDKKGTGYFQYIEITPFEDNARIEEVVIIRR